MSSYFAATSSLTKYCNMLKVCIPKEAVQHKMPPPTPRRVNNLDVDNPPHSQPSETSIGVGDIIAEVSLDFAQSLFRGTTTMSGETVATASTSNEKCLDTFTSELTSEEEVIAEKYRKMLKMGVPLDGVLHKMAQESVDLKITLVVLQEVSLPLSASAKVESDNTHQVKMSAKTDAPLLSDEEEAIATTYRNMLKVCIPKEAVRHKMKQDGIVIKIVEAVLGKDATAVTGSDSMSIQTKTTNRKTIAFHWTTSNLAPKLLEQSIFGRTLEKRKDPEESDIKKLEVIFQKRNNSNTGKIKTNIQEEGGNEMAKLLDLTRANNIAICLKSFNDFTFHSLAETIGDLDPDHKILGEWAQFLPYLLPTPKEIQAIKTYKGD